MLDQVQIFQVPNQMDRAYTLNVSRIFGFRNDQHNGINMIVMGPQRKSKNRLEEYFKEDM